MNRSQLASIRRLQWPFMLGLAAVGFLASVISLLGGGPTVLGMSEPQAQEAATEEVTPTQSETDAGPGALEARITAYEVFLARDPFQPVIPDAAVGGNGDGTGGDGGSGDAPTTPGSPTITPVTPGDPTPAVPTTSPTPTPTSTPTDGGTPAPGGGCVSNGSVQCDGMVVSLVDVFTDQNASGAVVRVDDALYEVSSGETFASNFRVLSIEAPCVTLQYGDDRFSLCEGESILK
jgi:hypothetical protein